MISVLLMLASTLYIYYQTRSPTNNLEFLSYIVIGLMVAVVWVLFESFRKSTRLEA